jgi:glucose-6-phosphate 1-dehydrogenase
VSTPPTIHRFGRANPKANRLFYFALPPTAFAVSAASINAAGRATNGWTRAIIEKPFGSNSKSYHELSSALSS